MTYSILLVDDHPLILRGYRSAIDHSQADLEVTGTATSGEEALDSLEASRPDVVIVDLSMEGMSGFELIERIHERWPDLRVLVVSQFSDPAHIREAVAAGADGYLLKAEAGQGDFVTAITGLLEKGSYFSNGSRENYDPEK